MNTKLKIGISILSLFFISIGILTIQNQPKFINYFFKKRTELILHSKKNYGGIIYNKTNKILKFSQDLRVQSLPPEMSTRDKGVFDADSLIINEPTYYKDDIYFKGVFKFCNLSSLEVIENDGALEIKAKNAWMCKMLNDFTHYDSIKDAFKP